VPLDNVVFWVFAPISVASAIGLLAMRNAVHAALFLVVNFFTLAVMFLLLDAPFLFAVQIVVYAGAIMVLFLFVIMLLGVEGGEPVRDRLAVQRPVAIGLGVAFAAEIASAVHASIGFATRAPAGFDRVNAGGNPQAVAKVLFRSYFFPFEATSVLLIVAAIAAMVMAQRKAPAVTQAEAEAARSSVDGPAGRETTA
jgi:NADH-quinone oxidoreductase subunit J